MLGVARVFMILAGLLGLPSVACSGFCSGIMQGTPNAPFGGEAFLQILLGGSAALVLLAGILTFVARATDFRNQP